MSYECKICNKQYSSIHSRSNHIRIYHNVNSSTKTTVLPPISTKIHQNKCVNCGKNFSRSDSLQRHQKLNRCKKEILIKKDEEILELKKQNENLMNMLQKALKIHPMTLNKINNQLNLNNSNNTINQTVNIVQLGHEDLCNTLSERQKMNVLDRQAMSLNNLVELVHVSGKFEKFQNVYITNLRSSFAYRFDEKLNKFISVNKNELLNDLLDCRMYDIEKFYKEIQPKLEPQKATQIKKFIERMANEEDKMKGLKREEITLILYNNREKIISASEKTMFKETPIKELEV